MKKKNPRILITGGNGFIGSHLVEVLLNDGVPPEEIRLLIPKKEILKETSKNLNIIRGSITEKQTVKSALKGIDTIYHLAALTIDGGKYYTEKEYQTVNVLGTKNILDEIRTKRIKKLIFFSSIAVYGLPAWIGNIENWDESASFNPQEIYGQSKWDAEKLIVSAHKKWHIPYVIIRPTSVYGPRDKRNLLELYKAIKKHLFCFVGNGNNLMDYVYVKDIARAARLAELSKYKNEDFIIGSGKPLTQNTVAEAVAKSINMNLLKIHLPKTIALYLSYMVLFASKIIGVKPMLFPQRVKVLTTNCYYNIEKSQKKLKFKPLTSISEGTKLTAKWLIETNQLN